MSEANKTNSNFISIGQMFWTKLVTSLNFKFWILKNILEMTKVTSIWKKSVLWSKRKSLRKQVRKREKAKQVDEGSQDVAERSLMKSSENRFYIKTKKWNKRLNVADAASARVSIILIQYIFLDPKLIKLIKLISPQAAIFFK